jgi:hypothetical protein
VVDSRKCVRLLRLPSLGGENNMSEKVPTGTMNGVTTHVGKSASMCQYQKEAVVIVLQS